MNGFLNQHRSPDLRLVSREFDALILSTRSMRLTTISPQNVGYIIPIPVVKHFLEDLARHGGYTGGLLCGDSMWGAQLMGLVRFVV